jgi:hypothetical protein
MLPRAVATDLRRQNCAAPAQRARRGDFAMATANVLSPFGFLQVGTASGPPNFAQAGSAHPYRIKAGFVTAIYNGDAVRMWISGDDSSGAAGYITPWVVGDGSGATKILVGIFIGCSYYSTSQKKTVWNNYYPGSDAAADVDAFVVDDPNSEWMVQGGASALGYATIGQTIDIAATPVGNTTTGQSGMSVVSPSTTITSPFKIVNMVTSPPGSPGRDVTSGYNNVIVAFNNQQFKALLGV